MMFILKSKYEKSNIFVADAMYIKNEDTDILEKVNSDFTSIWKIKKTGIYNLIELSSTSLIVCCGDKMELIQKSDGATLAVLPFRYGTLRDNYLISFDKTLFPFPVRCDKYQNGAFSECWVRDYLIGTTLITDFDNIYFYDVDKNTMKNNQHIISLNIRTGEENWRFQTLELGEENLSVKVIYGVYKGILIVNIGDRYVIGIDIYTGKIVWKNNLASIGLLPNSVQNLLLGMRSSYESITYIELNIKTGEIKREKSSNPNEIASQRDNYILLDTHIISTDWRKGKIVAYNISTHEFDWIWEEEGTSFYGQMKYFDPYLFVQNKDNTLYVFEKE